MLAMLAAASTACARPEDVCAPVTDRIGFFSQGDCIFTRARFFRGHEWITFFGNAELGDAERLDDGEVQWMALGNRRVDYPKELLAHLDNGVLAYVDALTERTERPDAQAQHFLLRGDDSERAAADAAQEHIVDTTLRALALWSDDRVRALTLLGQAQHTVQDSFSPAHTVRQIDTAAYGWLPSDGSPLMPDAGALAPDDTARPDATSQSTATEDTASPGCVGSCGCLQRVKAYLRRDEDFRTDVLYHGTAFDTIGHITTEDSIYRSGRDCHRPLSRDAVFACLNPHARQAVFATMTYLRWVRTEVASGNVGSDLSEERLRSGFAPVASQLFAWCEGG
jgi:hypothetical protein